MLYAFFHHKSILLQKQEIAETCRIVEIVNFGNTWYVFLNFPTEGVLPMRFIVLMAAVVLLFTLTACSASQIATDAVIKPESSVFILANEGVQPPDQLWYSPSSIQYYDDYFIVKTRIMLSPPKLGTQYVINTWYLDPQGKKNKLMYVDYYDTNGSLLENSCVAIWDDLVPKSKNDLLFRKVLAYVKENNIKAKPTPDFAHPNLVYVTTSTSLDHMFFNPGTIQVNKEHISVQVVHEFAKANENIKYIVETICLQPTQKQFKQVHSQLYAESGRLLTVLSDTDWKPMTPKGTIEKLLTDVLDYCRENNISAPQ